MTEGALEAEFFDESGIRLDINEMRRERDPIKFAGVALGGKDTGFYGTPGGAAGV